MIRAIGLILLLSVVVFAATPSALRLRRPLWVDNDNQDIQEPVEWRSSELYAIAYNSWLRHLSPEYKVSVAADPGALNVNAWDEVPNSSWFTNRIGRQAMTFEEILQSMEGKAPESGRWRIQRNSIEGYTPKFIIDDSQGRRYFLKFDLPAALERNSAAERISTLILHAAGYNVPHNSIVYFTGESLFSDERSQYEDEIARRRPLRAEDVAETLGRLKTLPDGRYRGLASLNIPGLKAIGRFFYSGTRKDDPNDYIPHEMRRELRGLRVIASWINHVDVGDKNAQDMYVEAEGRKFVKHYLLDFGSTMGSGDFVNGPFRVGHEYIFDGAAMGRSFLTLGVWQRPWDLKRDAALFPEIGYFQADLFEPERWKPNYPNLSFERMDDADAYWGAKIVTAFSDDLIARLAEAGEFSRREATRYLASVLRQRRDAIGNYWLNRITPLEEIALVNTETTSRLVFRDLAIERAYADRDSRTYQYWVANLKGRKLTPNRTSRGPELEFAGLAKMAVQASEPKTDPYGRTPLVRAFIQSNQKDGRWALPVEVIIGRTRENQNLQVLGWMHASQ